VKEKDPHFIVALSFIIFLNDFVIHDFVYFCAGLWTPATSYLPLTSLSFSTKPSTEAVGFFDCSDY
jgi:hypothetical protein